MKSPPTCASGSRGAREPALSHVPSTIPATGGRRWTLTSLCRWWRHQRTALRATDLVPFTVADRERSGFDHDRARRLPDARQLGPAGDALPHPAWRATQQRFDGLVVTDALIMDGALVGRRESDAAVEAVQAGADLLLYPNDARRVRDALEAALASGALGKRATERVPPPLRSRAGARYGADAAGDPGPYESADALADVLLTQGMMVRRSVPELTRAPRSGSRGR